MSSTFTQPDNTLGWFVSGNRLGLATRSTGFWTAVDETVTGGALVHYYGEPEPIPYDQPDQYLDIHPALHSPLVDYVKGKLFYDQAAKFAQQPEVAATYLALAREHMRSWKNMVNRRLPSLTAKIAGPRALLTFPINNR